MLITMPQLGETVTEGTIVHWFKAVGDAVDEDEPLFEVSTDKVDTEVPSAVGGVAHARSSSPRARPSRSAPALAVVRRRTTDDGRRSRRAGRRTRRRRPRPWRPLRARRRHPPARAGRGTVAVARRARITRDDVEAPARGARDRPLRAGRRRATAAPAAAATPTALRRRGPTTGSSRSRRSGGAPARTCGVDRDRRAHARGHAGRLLRRRAGPRAPSADEFRGRGGLRAHRTCRSSPARWSTRSGSSPRVNASVGADALVVHPAVHLGIAVDLDFEGLVVPVVRDAGRLRSRAARPRDPRPRTAARERRAHADDVTGGTFTITNAGGYGTLVTAPIINQPQVAIISTDGIAMRPVAVPVRRRPRHRGAPGRQPQPVVRPPRVRRRVRLGVPAAGRRARRDPRLGRGARVTSEHTGRAVDGVDA